MAEVKERAVLRCVCAHEPPRPPAAPRSMRRDNMSGTLKRALEADEWGQSLEAVEEYQRLGQLAERALALPALSGDDKASSVPPPSARIAPGVSLTRAAAARRVC